MDKETLSRFSWIIISSVVIAAVVAFLFSLVWLLGGDSVDSAHNILVIDPNETPATGGTTVGDKPKVTIGESLFKGFEYEISGSGFDKIKIYKNRTLIKTLNYTTSGLKIFEFDVNDENTRYSYNDIITIECYKGDKIYAWDEGPYNFFDDQGPVITVNGYSFDKTHYVNAKNAIELSGTVTDNKSGVTSFTLNGVPVTVNGDSSWSTAVTPNVGINTYKFKALDGSGITTEKTVTIYYDNVAPELTVEKPSSGTSSNPLYLYEDTVPTEMYTVSGKVSDSGIGVDYLTVNDKKATINKDGSWSVSVKLSATDVTAIKVVAVDKLGNKSSTVTKYVRWINWRDTDAAVQFISSSPFTITVPVGSWSSNGDTKKMEYHNGFGWQTWNAGTTITAQKRDEAGTAYCIYVRGTGLNKVTKTSLNGSDLTIDSWKIAGTDVKCSGNIETLLDYKTVKSGGHPSMAEACFAGMFNGQTALIQAPTLPSVNTLTPYCYHSMFKGTNITEVPALTATNLSQYCYRAMFQNCKMLTRVPENLLPATKTADNCYQHMFAGCNKLQNAPLLNATQVAKFCYNGMFAGCSSLTQAPSELPATRLYEEGKYDGTNCYAYMFDGCTSLVNAPTIYAEDYMAYACMAYMFRGCTSLKNVSELKAWYLTSYCYQSMFENCTSLETAPKMTSITTLNAGSCMDMFKGCTGLKTIYPLTNLQYAAEDSCNSMFEGCTGITSIPVGFLPATYLAQNCYSEMFAGCTGITALPSDLLPSNALYRVYNEKHYNGSGCYTRMFAGCTGITSIPEGFLPATNLAYGCYFEMFKDCKNLVTVPKNLLPSVNASVAAGGNGAHKDVYKGMFSGCEKLTVAPDLPAMNLERGCYESMFYGCKALAEAPELPAICVPARAYANMFSGCASLTASPELPATALGESCYESMFYGCTVLSTLPELPATTFATNCYKNMFNGCSMIKVSEGRTGEYTQLYLTPANIAAFENMFGNVNSGSPFKGTPAYPNSYYLHKDTDVVNVPISYLEFTSKESFTLSVIGSDKYWDGVLEYNIGDGWIEWDGKTAISANGEYHFIYIRGKNNHKITGAGGRSWILAGNAAIACNGNIETLLDYPTAVLGGHPQMASNCFRDMFVDCAKLVKAPTLPSTALTDSCYRGMFARCTGLTEAPALPATTLAASCYRDMFNGCTSLTTAPYMTVSTLAKYSCMNMFIGCTKLNSVANITLNDKTLEESCYEGMFSNCSALMAAPSMTVTSVSANSCKLMFSGCSKLSSASNIYLNAATAANSCYESMFQGCTNLSTAPTLSATKVADSCYKNMFSGCKNITAVQNITLGATTLANSCYEGMFQGCTNLSTVPAMSPTTLASSCCKNMFKGCSSITTAKNITLGAATLANNCYEGMFYGCSKLSVVPALPATALADGCYKDMFRGTAITEAPALPATTLKPYCYQYMFIDCTKLVTAPMLPATKLAQQCYDGMFTECTALKKIPQLNDAESATNAYIYLFNGCTQIKLSETYNKAEGYIVPYYIPNSSGNLDEMFIYTGGPFKGTPTAGKIYYLHESVTVMGQPCLEFASGSSFNITADKKWNGKIWYSTDDKTWIEWTGAKITSAVGKDGRYHIYFKGVSNTVITGDGASAWSISGSNVECNGSIELLLDYGVVMGGNHPQMGSHCFYNMFGGCTALKKAPELTSTTVSEFCYYAMFINCTNLTQAPSVLPATRLYEDGQYNGTHCYAHMFDGCTKLVTAPTIQAKDYMAYASMAYMFRGCTSLKTVSELKASYLTSYCYQSMFEGCTSLVTAPKMTSITTLNLGSCMDMFKGCTGLKTIYSLTNLKTVAENSCKGMFSGCTALTTVPKDLLPATNLEAGRTCYESMFSGCTKLTNAPDLPATTLEYGCYSHMFNGCTSLTSAPSVLPAVKLAQSCYIAMFANCDSLTSDKLPTINAEYLAPTCCKQMFKGCDGITTLNKNLLPNATALYRIDDKNVHYNGNNCYESMFENCANLASITANVLPAKNLASACYLNMFKDCIKLATVPKNLLPSTNTGNGAHANAYNGMFMNCKALKEAPDLPATVLAEGCYANMFSGCISLVVAPDLPATKLVQTSGGKDYNAKNCYQNMFKGCTALKTAPQLPAKTLAEGCYQSMFEGCKALNVLPALPATTMAANCYNSMFKGCSEIKISQGKSGQYTQLYLTPTNAVAFDSMFADISSDSLFNGTPVYSKSYYLLGSAKVAKDPVGYLEFTSAGSFTIGVLSATKSWNGTLQYNVGNGWTAWDGTSKITSGSKDGVYYIYVRGTGNTVITGSYTHAWTLTATSGVACNGNIETLLDYVKVKSGETITMKTACYKSLFQGWELLTSAPTLPATTLTDSCYMHMFKDCKNLASAPVLPAKTLVTGCYRQMFYGCTSLNTAPALSATTLATNCYQEMFYGCTSLKTAPALSVTTMKTDCYRDMFAGCSALTTAPALPATTLADNCYYGMFKNTGLTAAPALPATTLKTGCYTNMFAGCKSLTTAPQMTVSTVAKESCKNMFYNCTKLVTISGVKLNATALAEGCYEQMFMNCGTLTTAPTLAFTSVAANSCKNMFYKCAKLVTISGVKLNATTMADSCYYGMFRGCAITSAPSLPATTLANNCYQEMFYECTKLKTVSRNLLPAKTAKTNCYRDMFYGCTSLETVPLLPATTLAEYCYFQMFRKCTNLKEIPYLPATTLANHCYNRMFCEAIMSASNVRSGNLTTEYTIPVSATHVNEVNSNLWPFGQMFGEDSDKTSGQISITSWVVAQKPFYLPSGIKVVGKDFLEFVSTSQFSISVANKNWSKIEYSIDGGKTWTVWDGRTINSSSSGYCHIFLRGTGNKVVVKQAETINNEFVYYPWTINGSNVYCNGNIENLLDYNTVSSGGHPAMNGYCYTGMFAGSTAIVKAPDLLATTLSNRCYRSMFEGCTNLVYGVFELPANAAWWECYSYMFAGCTKLVNAPKVLPATTLSTSCYSNMFNGCTSLVNAPALPATTLAEYCYYKMFQNCKSLKQIPYLPATTLVNHCYNTMFNGAFSVSATKTGNFTVQYIMPITQAEVNRLTSPTNYWPVATMFSSNITFGTTQTVIYLPAGMTIVNP